MIRNTKKILIETESFETFTLRITRRDAIRLYCDTCRAIEEMLDLNVTADVTGVSAREILGLVESSVLHSPETTGGHLLICRASLEDAINTDTRLRPAPVLLKGSL